MLSSSSSTFRLSLPIYLGGRMPMAMPTVSSSASTLSFCSSSSSAPKLAPYMEHVKQCNRGRDERSNFLPFVVDNVTVGFIHSSFVHYLTPFREAFAVIKREDQRTNLANAELLVGSYVTLQHDLTSQEDRTESINKSLKILSQRGVIPGWREEMYPVVNSFGATPIFSLERAAVPYFGTKAYGVHMNGFSVDSHGQKYLWVAKRSITKQTFPGMLDHLVAGGQPVGISCKENIVKECDEEAGIPREMAERAVAVSAVSYEDIEGDRLKRDVLFCYDLELPWDFKPVNKDGEVDTFTLLPVEEVANILQTSHAYKPNCTLVVIDFLFRHGYITPDQEGYLQLFSSLRQGECL